MQVYAYLDGRILYDLYGHVHHLVQKARTRYRTYRAVPSDKHAIAHWLLSARIKITAAQNAGDELKAAYVTSITSWKILEGIWAARDQPMPPNGAVWAHVADVNVGQPDIEAWLRRLFGPHPSDRVRSAVEIMDWVVPLLEKKLMPAARLAASGTQPDTV